MSSPFKRLVLNKIQFEQVNLYDCYESAMSDFIDAFIEHFSSTFFDTADWTIEKMDSEYNSFLETYLSNYDERHLVQWVFTYGFDNAVDLMQDDDLTNRRDFIKLCVEHIFSKHIAMKDLWRLLGEYDHTH